MSRAPLPSSRPSSPSTPASTYPPSHIPLCSPSTAPARHRAMARRRCHRHRKPLRRTLLHPRSTRPRAFSSITSSTSSIRRTNRRRITARLPFTITDNNGGTNTRKPSPPPRPLSRTCTTSNSHTSSRRHQQQPTLLPRRRLKLRRTTSTWQQHRRSNITSTTTTTPLSETCGYTCRHRRISQEGRASCRRIKAKGFDNTPTTLRLAPQKKLYLLYAYTLFGIPRSSITIRKGTQTRCITNAHTYISPGTGDQGLKAPQGVKPHEYIKLYTYLQQHVSHDKQSKTHITNNNRRLLPQARISCIALLFSRS